MPWCEFYVYFVFVQLLDPINGCGTLPLNVENVVVFGSFKTFMLSWADRRLKDCTILKLSSAVWNE